MNGGDYVLDAIAEMELPPAFPNKEGRHPFLVSVDHSKGQLPLIVDTEMLLREGGDPRFRRSASPDRSYAKLGGLDRGQRARSHDRALNPPGPDFGLAKSALNERYFEEQASRSKSLDNLFANQFGLSGSKLNQRYHHQQEPKSPPNDLGLSTKTSLNDRYFSQPDLLSGRANHLRTVPGSDQLNDQDFDLDFGKHGRHGNPRFVKSGGKRRDIKSSAMSDTSEAPSIASHIKRVRVPSQASDVDQFLDDLFSPVLDGQTVDDGLSDAKSLAASMRGGEDEDEEVECISNSSQDGNLSGLCNTSAVLAALQGGKESPSDNKEKPKDFVGFQPIQGMISPTMSPPPMLMPTPILGGSSNPHSITSPLMMPIPTSAGGPNPDAGAAMAFTYVPVPVYNMAGMALPGMQGSQGMANFPGIMSPQFPQGTSTPGPRGPSGGSGASPPTQPSSMDTQQLAYQQAFLQNAVAQNMQIQQQLMMQNQALTQLLQQSSSSGLTAGTNSANSSISTIMGTPSLPSMIPMAQYQQMQQQQQQAEQTLLMAAEASRKISAGDILDSKRPEGQEMKQRSMSQPNTPKEEHDMAMMAMMAAGANPMDPYTRAKTVRIGKWRWPPPKEEMQGDQSAAEGFFEFKMRKMSEKKQEDGRPGQDIFDTSAEIQGIEWGVDEEPAKKQESSPASGSGSVGKIKLSSEMKEKLEAVTGSSRKNSSASRKSDASVSKLDETKKQLIEQKLGGSAGKPLF